MIHATSRQSFADLRDRLNEVLAARTSGHAAANANLAEELDSIAGLLASNPRLRRTLADPATDAFLRGQLMSSLLQGKVADETLDLVGVAVGHRWSSPWDLADAIQRLSDDVLLVTAEQQGQLDEVEDELFRFERILSDNGALITALDDANANIDRRTALLDSVVGEKVNPITLALLTHSIRSPRKHSLQLAIDDLLEASAKRRNRSVARVIAASELTDAQTERLGAALTGIYGRPISIRSAVDPDIMGGLQVRVGDELIDGTVATRLAAARAALAG